MASREHRWRCVLVVSAFLAATTSLVWSSSPEAWPGGKSALATMTSYQEPSQACLWPPPPAASTAEMSSPTVAWGGAAFQVPSLQSAFFQRTPGSPAGGQSVLLGVSPRTIRDLYPSFSGIAVDEMRNEIVVTDENLQQIIFYRRTENNAANEMAEPIRVIGTGANSPEDKHASKTNIEFQAGVYLDPRSGEVYGVNNDSHDSMVVFSRTVSGNVAPSRELAIPHGAFNIAVDEGAEEFFLTIQHDSAVVVFRKSASGDEAPLRLLQGEHTRLANPHGVALDPRNGLMFVTNQGAVAQRDAALSGPNHPANMPLLRDAAIPGSGKMLPPAITVHSKTASGDAAPIRVIEGSRTRLNWPTGIALNLERGELYVANDAGDSILVFDANAEGNVEPRRVLAGARTGLKNPTGLALDMQNGELWVANFGNHTATAYPLVATGDVAPLRTIRSAPLGTPSQMLGNPGGVAFDSRRGEILVPN